MKRPLTVLIIDDEEEIRRFLEIAFHANGYQVVHAASAGEGLAQFGAVQPGAVILDLGLPDADGKDVLQHIRHAGSVPVIILSVRSSEQDIIECLEAGADDYVVKPFRPGELIARLRNAQRRHQAKGVPRQYSIGRLSVDLAGHTVKKDGEHVRLTATEFELLSVFLENLGKVLTHKYLLRRIRGPHVATDVEYLRVYIRSLRKKLEDDPSDPRLFVTESGIGYRLVLPEEAVPEEEKNWGGVDAPPRANMRTW